MYFTDEVVSLYEMGTPVDDFQGDAGDEVGLTADHIMLYREVRLVLLRTNFSFRCHRNIFDLSHKRIPFLANQDFFQCPKNMLKYEWLDFKVKGQI